MIEQLYTMIIVVTYNFMSLKTSFFYVVINLIRPRYILHIPHGHLPGSHILILNLKAFEIQILLYISLGMKSHIFGPR